MSDLHKRLMEAAFYSWDPHEPRADWIERLSVLYRAAVRLGALNAQVENGGFRQWYDNDYMDEDIWDLKEICEEAIERDIYREAFVRIHFLLLKVEKTIYGFNRDIAAESWSPENNKSVIEAVRNHTLSILDDLDTQYYLVEERFDAFNAFLRYLAGVETKKDSL